MTKKSKEIKALTAQWFQAWETLLTHGIAIRSSLEFLESYSCFEAEVIFIDDYSLPQHRGVCRMYFKRYLGEIIGLHITKIHAFNQPPETFLEEFAEREHDTKGVALGTRSVQPVAHLGILTRLGSKDLLILPSSHPLLLLHYGMMYEEILIGKRSSGNSRMEQDYAAVCSTLKRRFGAFLHQQESALMKSLIGEIL